MRTARLLLLLFLGFIYISSQAAPVSVKNLRQWRAPDHTRLVFDLSAPLEHRLFTLRDPHRIVIDMDNARLLGQLPKLDGSGPLLAGVRTGRPNAKTLRIVLDLKAETRPRTFVLKPAGQYGHRLVIDLYDAKAMEEETKRAMVGAGKDAPSAPTKTPLARPVRRELVIAIDAGHGGEDPGAVGRRYRTREKKVTFAVARELKKLIARAPGMRPVMIRKGDYYIGLRERFRKARRYKADVFISIHADALPRRRAYGSSVYALSERGATDAIAKFVADKENASDLIGGVSLNDKDDLLAKVLLDLSQTKTIQDSLILGQDILSELRYVGPIHLSRVRQAGFTVLKAPDIPSVLVETAFISNPSEEKKLRTPAFQRKLARGIFKGVKRFVVRNGFTAPRRVAASTPREHVVRPGETLSTIARKYDVRVDALRFANNIAGNKLLVGRRLRIP